MLEDGAPALYRVRVAEQEARSSIGSGDAFLAGYVAARYAGQSPVECLRFGVACGAESTQHFGAGILDPARVERLLGEVERRAARAARPRSADAGSRRAGNLPGCERAAELRPVPLLASIADGCRHPLDRPHRRSTMLRWK